MKKKSINAWQLHLSALILALPSGLFVSLTYKDIWSIPWLQKFLLIFGITFLVFLLFRILISVVVGKIEFSKENLVRFVFLLIFSILITIFGGVKYIDKFVNLPPVELHISLLQDQHLNVENPGMWLKNVTTNSGQIEVPLSFLTDSCREENGIFFASNSENCTLTYLIDPSTETKVAIQFGAYDPAGLVEINIRAVKDQIDLTKIGKSEFRYEFVIDPEFSPKKVRYPINTISVVGIFTPIFLLFLFIDLNLLNKFEQKKDPRWLSYLKLKNGEYFVAILFLLIALIFANGRFGLGSNPLHFLGIESDAANISSFAAAYDHPENFQKDAFLSTPENYQVYFAFHIPLIRFLGSILHSYSGAFVVLLIPVLLIHLFGYYLLGKKIFNNKLLAFLLAMVTAIPIKLPIFEYFGFGLDVIPRLLFQALLPYLLLLNIKLIHQPKRWWIGALAFTALLYIHPVSGPAWLAAYFLSILVGLKEKPNRLWWRNFIFSIFMAVLGLIPFLSTYFKPKGSEGVDIQLVKEVSQVRLISQTIDVFDLYANYLKNYLLNHWVMITLWVFFILLLGTGIRYMMAGIKKKTQISDKEISDKKQAMIIIAWWLAILVMSIIIPLADEIYVQQTGNLPILREIRRNMRYYIPLLWISFLWMCSLFKGQIQKRFLTSPKTTSIYLSVFILAMLSGYVVQTKPYENIAFKNSFGCFSDRKMFCEPTLYERAKYEFYSKVSEIVRTDQLIFPDPSPDYSQDSLIPRYFCLRSIAYTYKDGGGAGSTTTTFLENWWQITQEVAPMLPNSEHALDIAVLDVARKTNSDYFIFINPDKSMMNALEPEKIAYRNDYGVLYDLR